MKIKIKSGKCPENLTVGKVYDATVSNHEDYLYNIVDDFGKVLLIYLEECDYLSGGEWEIVQQNLNNGYWHKQKIGVSTRYDSEKYLKTNYCCFIDKNDNKFYGLLFEDSGGFMYVCYDGFSLADIGEDSPYRILGEYLCDIESSPNIKEWYVFIVEKPNLDLNRTKKLI